MADNQRIEDLRRRVQRDPASIAFAQLAEELRRARRFEESVETCRAGLAIHPGYLSARVTLGRALIELQQLDEAQRELETVLRSAPENLAAIRGLAEIHHRNGNLREALAQYRAALALARNDPELQQTVADLARQVEPPSPPPSEEGLSFDQIRNELLKHAPPPKAAPPPSDFGLDRLHEVTREAPAEVEAPEIEAAPESAAEDGGLDLAAPPREEAPAAETTPALELSSLPTIPDPAREHAERTIAALEQWLDAVHVTRAERRT